MASEAFDLNQESDSYRRRLTGGDIGWLLTREYDPDGDGPAPDGGEFARLGPTDFPPELGGAVALKHEAVLELTPGVR